MDKFLGSMLIMFIIIITIMVFTGDLSWIFLVWNIVLLIWASTGKKNIEVGWKGQLLFLGERQNYIMNEGLHWVPFPFSIKIADCRETIIKLDTLEVKTLDDMMVKIDGSIKYAINDLNLYFGIKETAIKEGIDEKWDQEIRSQVSLKSLSDVFKMRTEIKKVVHSNIKDAVLSDWGIKIIEVIIASVKASEEVTKDLELKGREELQRKGQEVELQHFSNQVIALMKPFPDGPGLSREQAIEQVQIALGQSKKTVAAQNISLDPIALGMVAKILGGIK